MKKLTSEKAQNREVLLRRREQKRANRQARRIALDGTLVPQPAVRACDCDDSCDCSGKCGDVCLHEESVEAWLTRMRHEFNACGADLGLHQVSVN